MKTILLTGATGQIGQAIIRHYAPSNQQQLYVASRKKAEKLNGFPTLFFDFERLEESRKSLEQTEILFLLRPPHISDVQAYFTPLLRACIAADVKHIIFLSVQGADKASFIPHAKIEKGILQSGIPYTFIRPSYFMQNLTSTLQKDIQLHKEIFLPAGKAPFLWVDTDDIGKAVAKILEAPEKHQNRVYTITGEELLPFGEVAAFLSATLGRTIKYQSPTLLHFFIRKKKEGIPTSFILVMIMLHYLPRFQKPPAISTDFTRLTAEEPSLLAHFLQQHREDWL